MGLTAKVIIAVKNPVYEAGNGQSSTSQVEKILDHDPLFKHCSSVNFNLDNAPIIVGEIITEIRDKKWSVDSSGNTLATYQASAFGVKQADGSIYGND